MRVLAIMVALKYKIVDSRGEVISTLKELS